MVESIRISLCQIKPVVADLRENVRRIVAAHDTAVQGGARASVFPELAVSGMAPRDLLLRSDFLDACDEALEQLCSLLDPACVAIVGSPVRVTGADGRVELTNGVVVIADGRLDTMGSKAYPGADEHQQDHRYFVPGETGRYRVGDVDLVLAVADEIVDVASAVRVEDSGGQRVLINVVASPFSLGGAAVRKDAAVVAATTLGGPVVVVNGVGGNDGAVFDGGSIVVGAAGGVQFASPRFIESVDIVDVLLGVPDGPARAPSPADGPNRRSRVDDEAADVWAALTTGIRDYVDANGFPGVVLGLSGGVDSALVATLAADAIGAERVHCVLMPSRYSSEGSVADATRLAQNLGVDHRTIPIEPGHVAFGSMLAGSLDDGGSGLTDENLQARIRGMILMSLSNEFGWLVLACSNRSEALVGYSTMYGDSVGGLAPICDVYKLDVYELCRWYNARCVADGSDAVIPEAILTKAPSAELRPGQRDDQSLPPYEQLDPLLIRYVDELTSPADLIASGFDEDIVRRVTRLVDRSEYKRQQMPPLIGVIGRGAARRPDLPITRGSYT